MCVQFFPQLAKRTNACKKQSKCSVKQMCRQGECDRKLNSWLAPEQKYANTVADICINSRNARQSMFWGQLSRDFNPRTQYCNPEHGIENRKVIFPAN